MTDAPHTSSQPQPLPRNEQRFRHFSSEKPAVLPPDAKGDLMETTMANFNRLFGNAPESGD